MRNFFFLMLLLSSAIVLGKEKEDGLQMEAFLADVTPARIIINITNHGEKEVTVLTRGYGFGSASFRGRLLLDFSLMFDFLKWEWQDKNGNKHQQTYIPSLSDLSPVTLRKNETAQINVMLKEEYKEALARPENKVFISYEIRKEVAERFGLWKGRLELDTTVGKLRQETANKRSDGIGTNAPNHQP